MEEEPKQQEPILAVKSTPAQESSEISRAELISRLFLPISILIGATMISGTLLYISAVKTPTQGKPQVVKNEPIDISIAGSPTLGNENAEVTVVEFADFQCPFCKLYFQNNQASLVSQYINTGKVKFVWKDYAFLGQESTLAAQAARCANDQGKFWAYHDYLYTHQGAENSGAFSKARLETFARTLKLNSSQFNACLESGTYADAVQRETQYGSSIGVSGTPATYINGKLVMTEDGRSIGAADFSVFQAIIEAELKK